MALIVLLHIGIKYIIYGVTCDDTVKMALIDWYILHEVCSVIYVCSEYSLSQAYKCILWYWIYYKLVYCNRKGKSNNMCRVTDSLL